MVTLDRRVCEPSSGKGIKQVHWSQATNMIIAETCSSLDRYRSLIFTKRVGCYLIFLTLLLTINRFILWFVILRICWLIFSKKIPPLIFADLKHRSRQWTTIFSTPLTLLFDCRSYSAWTHPSHFPTTHLFICIPFPLYLSLKMCFWFPWFSIFKCLEKKSTCSGTCINYNGALHF